MKLYVLLKDGVIKTQGKNEYFPLPFTDSDLEKLKETNYDDYKAIDIIEDLRISKTYDD